MADPKAYAVSLDIVTKAIGLPQVYAASLDVIGEAPNVVAPVRIGFYASNTGAAWVAAYIRDSFIDSGFSVTFSTISSLSTAVNPYAYDLLYVNGSSAYGTVARGLTDYSSIGLPTIYNLHVDGQTESSGNLNASVTADLTGPFTINDKTGGSGGITGVWLTTGASTLGYASTGFEAIYTSADWGAGLDSTSAYVGNVAAVILSSQETVYSTAHPNTILIPRGTTDLSGSTDGTQIVAARSIVHGYTPTASVSTKGDDWLNALVGWCVSTGPLIPPKPTVTPGTRNVQCEQGQYLHWNSSLPHAASRWFITASSEDYTSTAPAFDIGWSTALLSINATGLTPGTDYILWHAQRDALDGASRWSEGSTFATDIVGVEVGLKVQFYSTSALISENIYHSTSTGWTETVAESVEQPAGTKYIRVLPYKTGSLDKGMEVRHALLESGNIAAGYHPAPFFPDRDDDTLVPPSWLDLGTSTSTGVAVDLSVARHQGITMAHNITFSFSGYQAGGRYLLLCEQDGTGSRLGVFGGVEWPGGTAPTLTTTTGAKDIIILDAESTAILHGDFRLDSK